MKERNLKREIIVFLSAATVLCAGSVYAADTPTVSDLDEVVVSATKTKQTVYEAPAGISVVSAADIEKHNVRTITEAIGMLPGVVDARPQGMSDVGSGISIRGYGENDILVLYDGMPLNDAYEGGVNWNAVAIDDVEKIELVRGAASSLYGGRAVGAVINITSKNPDKNTVKVYASYGSNDTWKKGIYVAQKLSDRLSFSFGYENKTTDGYLKKYSYASKGSAKTPSGTVGTGAVTHIRNTNKTVYLLGYPGTGASKDNTYNFKLKYKFAEGQTLTYRYTHDEYRYFGHDPVSYIKDADGNMLFNGSVLLPDGKYYNFDESDFTDYNGFRNVDIHALNYRDEKSKFSANFGFTNVKDAGYTTGSDFAGEGSGSKNHYPNKSYKLDFQKEWEIGKNQLIAGMDFQKDSMDYMKETVAHWGDKNSVSKVNSKMGGTNLTISAFIQDCYSFNKEWKMYAGLRWDRYRKYDGYYHDVTSDVKQEESTYNELSPKLAFEYIPNERSTYYVSYGHSFNPPTLYQMYRHDPSYGYIANPDLDPESTNTFEIGMKQKLNKKTTLTLSVYSARTKDLISAVKSGSYRQYVNIDEAKRNGFETELTHAFTPALTGYINYAYVDAKDGDGETIYSIPRHTFHAGLSYNRDKWSGYFEAEYVSSMKEPGEISHAMYSDDAKYTMNLGVNYKFAKGAVVGFAVNNLLNRDYWMWQHAAGRTYTVSLSYEI